jgi:hypothetical protein
MTIIDKAAAAYAAMRARFHGNQIDGEVYKQPPVYHSLGARGGRRDANGNRLDADGRVIGRNEAFYGASNPVNPHTRKPMGAWLR